MTDPLVSPGERVKSASLNGEKIRLRTLEPGDLEYLYHWENDPVVWQYGDCGAGPCSGTSRERFSRDDLRRFIENQQYGIHATGQLRLVICHGGKTVNLGCLDLFDFDPVERSAGVGILICDPIHRRRGYGREALELVSEYARGLLGLDELWCNIAADNRASIALFTGAGFVWDATTGERANDNPAQGVISLRKTLR